MFRKPVALFQNARTRFKCSHPKHCQGLPQTCLPEPRDRHRGGCGEKKRAEERKIAAIIEKILLVTSIALLSITVNPRDFLSSHPPNRTLNHPNFALSTFLPPFRGTGGRLLGGNSLVLWCFCGTSYMVTVILDHNTRPGRAQMRTGQNRTEQERW
ncbi:hypothetical protein QBC45DRAFT_190688 [Copromyces sp. CBS 386.78]|nr:hypothetical protein QBC45DRAFT_190688 [Copromyces sp. CBS 386.78]